MDNQVKVASDIFAKYVPLVGIDTEDRLREFKEKAEKKIRTCREYCNFCFSHELQLLRSDFFYERLRRYSPSSDKYQFRSKFHFIEIPETRKFLAIAYLSTIHCRGPKADILLQGAGLRREDLFTFEYKDKMRVEFNKFLSANPRYWKIHGNFEDASVKLYPRALILVSLEDWIHWTEGKKNNLENMTHEELEKEKTRLMLTLLIGYPFIGSLSVKEARDSLNGLKIEKEVDDDDEEEEEDSGGKGDSDGVDKAPLTTRRVTRSQTKNMTDSDSDDDEYTNNDFFSVEDKEEEEDSDNNHKKNIKKKNALLHFAKKLMGTWIKGSQNQTPRGVAHGFAMPREYVVPTEEVNYTSTPGFVPHTLGLHFNNTHLVGGSKYKRAIACVSNAKMYYTIYERERSKDTKKKTGKRTVPNRLAEKPKSFSNVRKLQSSNWKSHMVKEYLLFGKNNKLKETDYLFRLTLKAMMISGRKGMIEAHKSVLTLTSYVRQWKDQTRTSADQTKTLNDDYSSVVS